MAVEEVGGLVDPEPTGASGFRISFRTRVLIGEVNSAINKAFKEVAPRMQRAMQQIAPVDTGRLKGSIRVQAVRKYGVNEARLKVNTVYYGRFQEFGTSKMAAQPFIFPVAIGQRSKWRKEVLRRSKRYMRRHR